MVNLRRRGVGKVEDRRLQLTTDDITCRDSSRRWVSYLENEAWAHCPAITASPSLEQFEQSLILGQIMALQVTSGHIWPGLTHANTETRTQAQKDKAALLQFDVYCVDASAFAISC